MNTLFLRTIHSLRFKLLCVTLTLYILFTSVATYFWYGNMTRQATATSANDLSAMMQISNNNFETSLKEINSVTALISTSLGNGLNDRIFNYLLVGGKDDAMMLRYRRDAENYIVELCEYKSYLNSMAVYDLSGNSLAYGPIMDGHEVLEQSWYKKLITSGEDVVWVPPHYYSSDRTELSDMVFSIARTIRYHQKVIGVAVADVKCSLLDDIFNISNINNYNMVVMDARLAQPIFPLNSKQTWTANEISGLAKSAGQGNGRFFLTLGGKNCLAVSQKASLTGWNVIGYVPYNDILSDFLKTRNEVFAIALLCGIAFILCIFLFTSLTTRNLRKLSRAVSHIDRENLELGIQIQSNDEAGQLYQQITFMIERIKELIGDIRLREDEKRRLEIAALQAQINPHFLYNTLNTIKFLAALQNASNIQKVSEALSEMLHVNLSKEKYVTVAEEIHYLQDYIEIQEYRYSGKFQCYFQAEEDTGDKMVPKLLIQPLVENALKHGISDLSTPGTVQIRFFSGNGMLHIRVKDNGKGMDEEKVSAVTAQSPDDSDRIGLANVQARIRLLFGSNCSFSITSMPSFYTTVELAIPLIQKGEENSFG